MLAGARGSKTNDVCSTGLKITSTKTKREREREMLEGRRKRIDGRISFACSNKKGGIFTEETPSERARLLMTLEKAKNESSYTLSFHVSSKRNIFSLRKHDACIYVVCTRTHSTFRFSRKSFLMLALIPRRRRCRLRCLKIIPLPGIAK